MKLKHLRLPLIVLLALTLLLCGWRGILAIVINGKLDDLREAGLPTNGEELNRWYSAIPDSENSALVLTQAFARLCTVNTSPDKRAQDARKLRDKLPRRVGQLAPEQAALMRWFVETNLLAMAIASEATKLPASRYPVDYRKLYDTELPHLSHLSNLAVLYQYQAWLDLLDSRAERVPVEIEIILALAKTVEKEPCTISQLVRFTMLGSAAASIEARLNAGPLSPAECQRLGDKLSDSITANRLVLAFVGERAMAIPCFRMSRAERLRLKGVAREDESHRGSPWPYNGPFVLKLVGYYDLDFAAFLTAMDRVIDKLSDPPPANLRALNYMAGVGEAATKRGQTLSGHFFSTLAPAVLRENEAIARVRLARCALAIESFQRKAGQFPRDLEELVPDQLAEVPEDPFTGSNLQYRQIGGGYLLYSAGRDRKDDGGWEKADKKQSDDKKSYDITFTVER